MPHPLVHSLVRGNQIASAGGNTPAGEAWSRDRGIGDVVPAVSAYIYIYTHVLNDIVHTTANNERP